VGCFRDGLLHLSIAFLGADACFGQKRWIGKFKGFEEKPKENERELLDVVELDVFLGISLRTLALYSHK